MTNDSLRPLVKNGLLAMRDGTRQAAEAAAEVQDSATDSDLKDALRQGEQTTQTWRSRIDQAIDALGVEGENDNAVIEAVYQVAQEARQAAEDDDSRDLGIIASGQIALHYWIASFGTTGSYLKQMGHQDAAASMSECVTEAERADKEHTRIAKQIMADA